MTLARRSSPAADGGVARSAWLLVGAILLLTVLLTALAVGLLYQYQRQRLHGEAANASQLDAEQAQAILNAARFQVQATKRELLLRAGARHWLEHPDELQALLTEIERVSPQPSIFGLGAIDRSGRVLALSFQPDVQELDVSERPYFRALAAGAEHVLGTPVVAWDVGAPAISYLEWLNGEAGEPVLIVGVSIDLGFLERLYGGIAGRELAASALFRDDGVFMAGTWPFPELDPLQDDDGWLLERTAVTGWPLVAVAGAPKHAVWRGILLPSALIGGIVLLLGASIALVTRALEQRRRAHAALLRTEQQQKLLHGVSNLSAARPGLAWTSDRIEEAVFPLSEKWTSKPGESR